MVFRERKVRNMAVRKTILFAEEPRIWYGDKVYAPPEIETTIFRHSGELIRASAMSALLRTTLLNEQSLIKISFLSISPPQR